MKPEDFNPEEFEVRITAMLLGELSAEEEAEVRAVLAEDAGLMRLHDRLQLVLGLVKEASAPAAEPSVPVQAQALPEPLTLAEERRAELLAVFQGVQPKEKEGKKVVKVSFWQRQKADLLKLAAMLVGMLAVGWLMLPKREGEAVEVYTDYSITGTDSVASQAAQKESIARISDSLNPYKVYTLNDGESDNKGSSSEYKKRESNIKAMSNSSLSAERSQVDFATSVPPPASPSDNLSADRTVITVSGRLFTNAVVFNYHDDSINSGKSSSYAVQDNRSSNLRGAFVPQAQSVGGVTVGVPIESKRNREGIGSQQSSISTLSSFTGILTDPQFKVQSSSSARASEIALPALAVADADDSERKPVQQEFGNLGSITTPSAPIEKGKALADVTKRSDSSMDFGAMAGKDQKAYGTDSQRRDDFKSGAKQIQGGAWAIDARSEGAAVAHLADGSDKLVENPASKTRVLALGDRGVSLNFQTDPAAPPAPPKPSEAPPREDALTGRAARPDTDGDRWAETSRNRFITPAPGKPLSAGQMAGAAGNVSGGDKVDEWRKAREEYTPPSQAQIYLAKRMEEMAGQGLVVNDTEQKLKIMPQQPSVSVGSMPNQGVFYSSFNSEKAEKKSGSTDPQGKVNLAEAQKQVWFDAPVAGLAPTGAPQAKAAELTLQANGGIAHAYAGEGKPMPSPKQDGFNLDVVDLQIENKVVAGTVMNPESREAYGIPENKMRLGEVTQKGQTFEFRKQPLSEIQRDEVAASARAKLSAVNQEKEALRVEGLKREVNGLPMTPAGTVAAPEPVVAMDLYSDGVVALKQAAGPVAGVSGTPMPAPVAAEEKGVKQDVSVMVQDAKLLYELRKTDEAEAKLKEVIKKDPSNQAAYYYMNLVEEARYGDAARKRDFEQRSRIVDVERAWEIPVKREASPTPNPYVRTNQAGAANGPQGTQSYDLAKIELPKETDFSEEGIKKAVTVTRKLEVNKLKDDGKTDAWRKAREGYLSSLRTKDQLGDVLGNIQKDIDSISDNRALLEREAIGLRSNLEKEADGKSKKDLVAWAEKVKVIESQIAEVDKQIEGKIAELRKLAIDENASKILAVGDSKSKEILAKKAKEEEASRKPAATPPGIPQPEVITAQNAFSTFSLNVSDVSFKLAAASLEKGLMPDPGSVRTEEFINALNYHDPEPTGNSRIAFAWERARYPFAHDRDLLRFSVQTAAVGREPGKPLNIVLLLDNSGSMERADRVRIRQECLRVLASQLQPQDTVSVVAFARAARLWVDGLGGAKIQDLPKMVGELTPEGGTNLEEAMNLAYQTAQKHYRPNGVNRVVLLTDGAANLGDVEPASLKKKVVAYRQQGVALDCFGIGWEGYNDDLLEALSRNGDGRYGFVNSPEAATTEFAAQLAGALKVAASDVKVQVEWNPKRVTVFRQFGYAKHQLKKEEFRDNKVDAAEIGAAEAGNALYTVQVNPAGEGPLGVVRVRYRLPNTADYREHEWTLAYDGPAKAMEQASVPMRLAATSASFSEWLVSSPYAAEVSTEKLLQQLAGVPEAYPADPRPKQLEWMIRQAKSLSGR